MKSILVTGGLGYIGSHICVLLLEKNYNVVIIDNLSNSNINVLSKLTEITGKTAVYYNIDMKDIFTIYRVFRENEISHVIHLAGLKSVNESIKSPLLYYQNNIISTINLLDVMHLHQCDSIIFSSSATVYGTQKSPNTESQRTGVGITSSYGKTKFMNEEILKDYYQSKSNMKIIILRYFNPIGKHESGILEENPNNTPNNLFPLIVKTYKKEMEELLIYGNNHNTPDGYCIRDFIHVCDVAEAHIEVMSLMNEPCLEIFNVGTGKGISVLELITEFERINGKINKRVVEKREGDLSSIYADCSKLISRTNWRPKKTLTEAVTL